MSHQRRIDRSDINSKSACESKPLTTLEALSELLSELQNIFKSKCRRNSFSFENSTFETVVCLHGTDGSQTRFSGSYQEMRPLYEAAAVLARLYEPCSTHDRRTLVDVPMLEPASDGTYPLPSIVIPDAINISVLVALGYSFAEALCLSENKKLRHEDIVATYELSESREAFRSFIGELIAA